LIGGTIEKGETFEETLTRELLEEGNLSIKDIQPVGYQKCVDTRDNSFFYQLRFTCNGTKIGEFKGDPAGSIDMITFVTQEEYKNYFDWGTIGEEIIKKAYKIRKNKL
jgi:NADH pyrophosphatase NudC (nudix superfamily)